MAFRLTTTTTSTTTSTTTTTFLQKEDDAKKYKKKILQIQYTTVDRVNILSWPTLPNWMAKYEL